MTTMHRVLVMDGIALVHGSVRFHDRLNDTMMTTPLSNADAARAHVARALDDWLDAARVDADRRGLPELKPLLGGLQAALRELRMADWNDDFAVRGENTASGNRQDAADTEARS